MEPNAVRNFAIPFKWPVVRREFRILCAATLAILGLTIPAAAHHGFSRFESTVPLFFEGTIREVYWQYPHSYVRIEVAPDGALAADDAPGATLAGRQVPEGSQVAPGGEWTLFISAFWQLEKVGVMGTDLRDNDTFRAIAYLSCDNESDAYVAFVEVRGTKRHWVTETTLPVTCK